MPKISKKPLKLKFFFEKIITFFIKTHLPSTKNHIESKQNPRQKLCLESGAKPERDNHFFIQLTPNIQDTQY